MSKVEIYVGDLTPAQQDQMPHLLRDIQVRLNRILKTGHCTVGLVVDLARSAAKDTLDLEPIFDEIRVLEDPGQYPTRTKGIKQFRNPPLKGLSYTHYFNTIFLLQNIKNEFDTNSFDMSIFPERENCELGPSDIRALVDKVVVKNFEQRSTEGRLTGEWIIFEVTPHGNYYLTLAEHREGQNRRDGDQIIFDRITHYRSIDDTLKNVVPPPSGG